MAKAVAGAKGAAEAKVLAARVVVVEGEGKVARTSVCLVTMSK